VRITFDTNTLDSVARPERFPKNPQGADFYKVHDAVKAGTLKGYFSETIVTLEGIEKKDRIDVMNSTRLDEHRKETVDQDTGQVTINLELTVRQNRNPLHREHAAMLLAALKIGIRALKAPSRAGWTLIQDPDGSFFAADTDATFVDRVDRTSDACAAIEAGGLGFAEVISLAKSFASRDQADIIRRQEEEFAKLDEILAPAGLRAPRISFEEPWYRSLLRAKDIHEQRQVQRAIAEWADADSIASHIGYGLDLFCTEDHGKTGGSPSVFDSANRAWLEATYSVKFVTLSQLAGMI
jgi:hypothetical protein